MWKCPKCETLNNDEKRCFVCGEPRIGEMTKEEPVQMWQCLCGSSNNLSDKFCGRCGAPNPNLSAVSSKDNKLLIAVISSICVLAVVVSVVLVYFFFFNDLSAEDDYTDNTQAVETEDTTEDSIYYVNKFTSDGIFVRSGPSKSYSKILHIQKGDTSVRLKYLDDIELGDDGYYWYLVETPDGTVGYVREDVVIEYE